MSGPHERQKPVQSSPRSARDAAERLEVLLSEASGILVRISELYGILADRADPEGKAEAELLAQLEARARVSAEIGRAALQVLSHGGMVTTGASSAPIPLRPVPVPTPTAGPARVVRRAAPVPRAVPSHQEACVAYAKTVGEPASIASREHAAAAVHRLAAAVQHMDEWLELPQDSQKALMGLASSLARQIQDESEFALPFVDDEALRSAFSRMTAWSREHRPGFVPGLSRSNMPDHGSWLDDGRHWWNEIHKGGSPERVPGTPEFVLSELSLALEGGVEEPKRFADQVRLAVDEGIEQDEPRLVKLLVPHQSLLRGARGLKTLKTALRDAFKHEEEAAAESASEVGDDWPHLASTEGKHAVVVGGDERPRALSAIKSSFRLGTAVWEDPMLRSVMALTQRIRAHEVDLVIMLQSYASLRVQDLVVPACVEAGVRLVVVPHGHTVDQVRRAFGG